MNTLELSLTDQATGRTVKRSRELSDTIVDNPLSFARAVGTLRVALSEEIHTPEEAE